MAKTKSRVKTATRTRRTAAESMSTRLCSDSTKDDHLRRWAGKIMSELPSGIGDALIVLKYAERLVYWAAIDDAPHDAKLWKGAAR